MMDTRTIRLADGAVAIVDADDFDQLAGYRWQRSGWRGQYAGRRVSQDGKQTTVYMHRLILNAPSGIEVDHVNGDKLDNRKSNLRLATRSQNEQNKPQDYVAVKQSRSGHRNVLWSQRHGKWRVCLMRDKKHYSFGYFDDLDDAIVAAERARASLFTHAREAQAR